MASTSSEIPTSEFLNKDQRSIRKKQLEMVVAHLEAWASRDLVEAVKSEVGNGHHLTYFPERKEYWERCIQRTELDDFIVALLTNYITLLQRGFRGKQKYAVFQVRWMEFVRQLLHIDSEAECSTTAIQLWTRLSGDVDVTADSKGCIAMCIARAVFMFCQKSLVSLKEGKTLLLESEQDTIDTMEEAGHDVDEASLFRLGGYSLHSLLKAFEERKSDCESEVSVLCALKMPQDEKCDLPANIFYLDKGGMTFMRREMLGYLAWVYSIMKDNTSAEHARLHGPTIMKVIEGKVTSDSGLLRIFQFSCAELGVTSANEVSVLPDLHLRFVKKMVHIYGNELLENRRLLLSQDAGVTVEVPLMLRDKLKVMAAKE